MPSNLFVSYSHHDSGLVEPIVKILRINSEFVFYDKDSLRSGERWRGQIGDALEKARLVVVFWCAHSSRSDEVLREYAYAFHNDKDILPILLDDTPLSAELAEFQWIDCRELAKSTHERTLEAFNKYSPMSPAPVSDAGPPLSKRSKDLSFIWIGLAAIIIGTLLYLNLGSLLSENLLIKIVGLTLLTISGLFVLLIVLGLLRKLKTIIEDLWYDLCRPKRLPEPYPPFFPELDDEDLNSPVPEDEHYQSAVSEEIQRTTYFIAKVLEKEILNRIKPAY